MKRRDTLKLILSGAGIGYLFHQLRENPSNFHIESLIASLPYSNKTINTKATVNWAKIIAKSTPKTFGSNDFQVVDIKNATDTTYRSQISKIGFGLIRIHQAEISDKWSNSATRTWDFNKIKAIYNPYYSSKATVIQNIPGWPKWMASDKQGLLQPSEYKNYANFCSQLVDIINNRLRHNVIYWEPLNEQDVRYQKAGKLDELWKIYNLAASAMKAKDSKIKIGGPVLTWDEESRMASFLEKCKSNVDFISWHRYASSNPKDSTDSLMSNTPYYGEQVKKFRALAKQYVPNRYIPLFLGEYNINYSWKSGEKRHQTHIGAVWFASVLKHLAEAGIDMSASWNIKDGVYGLIDPNNKLRPPATLFTWAIKYLTGSVASTTTNNSFIEIMAVKQASGKYSLLLINKLNRPAQVTIDGMKSIKLPHTASIFYLDANGVKNTTSSPTSLFAKPFSLAPYSVAVLHL
jgi:Glycosyl hydrolases family 39